MFLVQMLYVNNKNVYPIGSMEIGVFVLQDEKPYLHNVDGQ